MRGCGGAAMPRDSVAGRSADAERAARVRRPSDRRERHERGAARRQPSRKMSTPASRARDLRRTERRGLGGGDRIATPLLYGIVIAAELFNLMQALGFWWTVSHERVREKRPPTTRQAVDVFIPVYKEPADIVDLTVAAAVSLRGAEVRVHGLDDGNDDAMRELAKRYGFGYIRRAEHTGTKAGNINDALTKTSAPFIAVFDSDHVADPGFLEATLGWMEDPKIAFVQMPQYYANTDGNRIAAASWPQQALFFGAIARRLGPEDTAACVSQQQRWARGCRSGIPRALKGPSAAEAEGPIPALRPVLPVRLDGSHLHELPGRAAARRRAADRAHRRTGVPAPFRALLRDRADDGRGGGCRLVHLRRLRARCGQLLDPHPAHGPHRPAQEGLVRGHPEEGRRGTPAPGR